MHVYAILITEQNRHFIGQHLNNGVVPEVELNALERPCTVFICTDDPQYPPVIMNSMTLEAAGVVFNPMASLYFLERFQIETLKRAYPTKSDEHSKTIYEPPAIEATPDPSPEIRSLFDQTDDYRGISRGEE